MKSTSHINDYLPKSLFILAIKKPIFKCLDKLGNCRKIFRFACARGQHVILGKHAIWGNLACRYSIRVQ